jgi:periplasmic protein TonB
MRRFGGLLLSAVSHATGLTLIVALPLLTDAGGPPPALPPTVVIPEYRVALPARGGHERLSDRRANRAGGAKATPLVRGPWVVSPGEGPGVGDAPVGDPLAPTTGEGLCLGCPEGRGVPGAFESGELLTPDPPRPRPVRPGGLVTQPHRIHSVAPVYPELARAARVQGDVVIDCVIDSTGHVSEARVVSGHPLLDEAALAAVRRWIYTPTLLNGVPISVLLTVTVVFELR